MVDEHGRIERVPYELCVLVALRDAIRRREVYVDGARPVAQPRGRPARRLRRPTARSTTPRCASRPTRATFIADLRAAADRRARPGSIRRSVDGTAGGVRITTRRGEPWITVPKLDRAARAAGALQALKDEVQRRWGTVDLLDMLKDADLLTDFTAEFTSVASREVIDRGDAAPPAVAVLFALGTNMGIKRDRRPPASTARPRPRCAASAALYITRDNLRRAIAKLVNATFAVRDPRLVGRRVPRARRTRRSSAPGRRT